VKVSVLIVNIIISIGVNYKMKTNKYHTVGTIPKPKNNKYYTVGTIPKPKPTNTTL